MQTSNFIEFLKISEDLEKKNQIQRPRPRHYDQTNQKAHGVT